MSQQHRPSLPTLTPPAPPEEPPAGDLAPTLRDDQPPRHLAPPHDRPRVAGYEIVRELGRGGMGVVYLARERDLDRFVALKMIRAGSQASADDLARLRAEAEAVARLQHPGIVQIYAVGQLDGLPYLALEFCAGGSLEARLAGRMLPPRQAAALVESLARAVQHAHERGIIHRDLKPANILLQTSNYGSVLADWSGDLGAPGPAAGDLQAVIPKLTDFGLAKRLDLPAGLTHSGAILGTPNYMAPEQAGRKRRELDHRVDVYALGAILYELVTSRPPFAGETVLETLEQVVRADPVPPAQLRPGLPRDLETMILKCLRKDPRQRYGSALELAEDCAAFCKGEPIRARAATSWEQALHWVRRRPSCAALLGACAAAVLGLLGLLAWHNAELNSAVIQARAQEKAAQLNHSNAEARNLLLQAEAALGRGAWVDARLQADKALTALDGRPELADLTAQAERLRRLCLQRLQEQAAQSDLLRRYQIFLDLRDEALFHASLFTGLDAAANQARTRTAAREALAQVAVSETAALGSRERSEVLAGRQELFLVLAESVAHPVAGQSAEERRASVTEAVTLLREAAASEQVLTRAYHLRLARYLEQLGRKGEADAERARALPPSTAVDFFLMGDERRLQGDLAQACLDFESALGKQPNHFWARYGLAFCCLRQRRLPEAHAALTFCLGHRPDFAWLYALRGFVHGELGNAAAAEADFDSALTLTEDATTRYGVFANRGALRFQQARAAEDLAALQAAPWLPLCTLYGAVGQAYRDQRLGQAADDLRQAVRLRPMNYQAHVSLGQVLTRQNRPVEARAEFDEAVRLAPTLADLYRTRAGFASQVGDHAAARADLQKAIQLEPARGSITAEDHVKLAQLWQRERQHEAAAQACAAALRLCPDHGAALRLQAAALLALRRYQEAMGALDRYLARPGAGREGSLLAEAYRLRGLTRTQVGQYDEALHDYTRALECQPDALTRCYRGWIYLARGAPRLALADFEEALSLDAGLVEGLSGRASTLARLGRCREAVKDVEAALERQPPAVRTLHHAAAVYAQAAAAAGSEARRRQLQERALDLLAQALAAVPAARRSRFWGEQVLTDSDLDSIRQLPRFQQLTPPDQAPPRETRGESRR